MCVFVFGIFVGIKLNVQSIRIVCVYIRRINFGWVHKVNPLERIGNEKSATPSIC